MVDRARVWMWALPAAGVVAAGAAVGACGAASGAAADKWGGLGFFLGAPTAVLGSSFGIGRALGRRRDA